MLTPELRQLRYVVEVADQHSFTHAAERLHIAQQALSQQVKTVEDQIGVTLFTRTNRGVELTPAGTVFVQEARRALGAAERVVSRTQAAERGQVGLVRIAHTLSSVYATLPTIVARITEAHPGLEVQLREVFAGDLVALLLDGKFDLAICPRMAVPRDISRRELRREAFVAALSETHPLAARERLELAELAHERFEIWPRELAPGYHDAIVAACREAGFEPTLDEHASGGTVWGAIGQGKGVALVVRSLEEQVPRGIKLVDLVEPAPTLMFELLWHADFPAPAVGHVVVAASAAAKELGWLQ